MRKFAQLAVCLALLVVAMIGVAFGWALQISTATIDNTTHTTSNVVTLHKYTRAISVAIPTVTSTYSTAKVSLDNSAYFDVHDDVGVVSDNAYTYVQKKWQSPTGTGGIEVQLPASASMYKYIYFIANDNQTTLPALKVVQWGAQ